MRGGWSSRPSDLQGFPALKTELEPSESTRVGRPSDRTRGLNEDRMAVQFLTTVSPTYCQSQHEDRTKFGVLQHDRRWADITKLVWAVGLLISQLTWSTGIEKSFRAVREIC